MHVSKNEGELCDPCRLLVDSTLQKCFENAAAWRKAEDMDVWYFSNHHKTLAGLLTSATTCKLCRLMYADLVQLQDEGRHAGKIFDFY